jgi:hypothetical protein
MPRMQSRLLAACPPPRGASRKPEVGLDLDLDETDAAGDEQLSSRTCPAVFRIHA